MEISLNICSYIKKFEDNSNVYKNIISQRNLNKKNDMPKPYISIIIPCYNVENYIDRCMQSIVLQTIGIENLQIIMVNDASTDNTLEKMRDWEKEYPKNIILITYDENIRQGGARNIALCYADADYVSFVDSDDWVELDMFEILYKKTKEKKWDIVKCKSIRDYGFEKVNDESFEFIYFEFEKNQNCGEKDFYRGEITNRGEKGIFGGLCGAIYLKELIFENDIWFPERLAYEDDYWWSIFLLYMKNLCIADKTLYHYYFNENSTITKRNALHHFDSLNIELMILEEYKKRGAFNIFYSKLEEEFIEKFYLKILNMVFNLFDYIPDIFNFMKEKIYFYFPNFINEIDISNYDTINQQLLQLLCIKENIDLESMAIIKNAYLDAMKKKESNKLEN